MATVKGPRSIAASSRVRASRFRRRQAGEYHLPEALANRYDPSVLHCIVRQRAVRAWNIRTHRYDVVEWVEVCEVR